MTYRRALDVLAARRETRIRLGLARVRGHLCSLGDPQEAFGSVHVAGTNGKGSVCAFLDSILRQAGLKAGLYLSPHLEDVRERICVNGRRIPPEDFARLMARTLRHESRDPLTYFELMTSIAFQYFRERGVDVAVLETGLGGRYDATNVVRRPLATLIPSIDYDHMNFLGRTLASIAREKAGIFKRGSPAFCAETKPGPLRVLRAQARRIGAPLHPLPRRTPLRIERVLWHKGMQTVREPGGRRLRLGILGLAQARNAALVRAAIGALRKSGLEIAPSAVSRGLAQARWPGRFEVLRRGRRTIILDGAHNVEAMRHFLATLKASPWRDAPKVFIVGFLRDKQYREMLRILAPEIRSAIATQPPSPRALIARELGREIRRVAPEARISVMRDPEGALRAGLSGSQNRVACVCGSFYLVGLARRVLKA